MREPSGEFVTLNNGVRMPALGLGLFEVPGSRAERVALDALEVGYRRFDTASIYCNEEALGRAIAGVERERVFITTKLWYSDYGYDETLRAFDESRARLGVDYLDLYLIHWPVKQTRLKTWEAMVTLLERGDCRAIGVSNFNAEHLAELIESSHVTPAVNQVEFSPFLYQRELLRFCRDNSVRLEAYSPLTQGKKLKHPLLASLAEKYGKSPAQILIRWSLDRDLAVTARATRREHMEENAGVFDFTLSPEDRATLEGLHEGFRANWDPTGVP